MVTTQKSLVSSATMIRSIVLAAALLALPDLASSVSAFVPPSPTARANTSLSIFGSGAKKAAGPPLPTFDKSTQKWIPSGEDDEEGWGPGGSLLRFGPLPFVKRLTNPDEYEQAVLKYQATEKCGRAEAQGNMDAYFENPQDWAMQKMEEKKGGYKRDYTLIDTKKVVLTLTWAVIVTPIVFSIFFDLVSGNYCTENPAANFCVFTGKIIHPGRY